MSRKNARRCLIAAGVILALFLILTSADRAGWTGRRESSARTADSFSSDSDSGTHASSRPNKTGPREIRAKATDVQAEKFRRFFLPPIELKHASIGEAMAAVIAAYRETALASGEEPVDLRVNLSHARTDKPLNLTTPRATAGTVIRYLAALSGNRTTGALPNFRLEGLPQTPDRAGKLLVPPAFDRLIAAYLASERTPTRASLSENPFEGDPAKPVEPLPVPGTAPGLREVLKQLGFESSLESEMGADGKLAYRNASEAELELLGSLVEVVDGGEIGPVQMKSRTTFVMTGEDMVDSLVSGTSFNAGEEQLLMRQFAQKAGTDLMTIPSILARDGEMGMIHLPGAVESGEGAQSWNGVKFATTSVPYGLGTEVEFAYEMRGPGEQLLTARQRVLLPEDGRGVVVTPQPDGKRLVAIHSLTLVDSAGQPIVPK